MPKTKRFWPIVAVVVLLFLVNLPIGHLWWSNHRLDTDGQVTQASVDKVEEIGSGDTKRYFVTFTLPRDVDPERHDYAEEVTRATWQTAKETDRIEVTYLVGHPSANRAAGNVPPGNVGLVLTLLADLAILGMFALMLWVRRHDVLELVATRDVARCKPGDLIEELEGGHVMVRGDVLEIEDDHVVLVSGGKRVKVILAGFANPVGHQQPAEAHGRKVPPR
ncbi:hypothetical protein [Nocardioides sp. Soil796]|uniref:hypothetical protein n=1 Tax=Nocardioides sp. Soil796 TaxID=1736412 RepID=UPI00070EA25C|nr:hypothetical protein [Nocardioides sp. Soil796]KRF20346.1 hypothetical protein ASH02_21740 [Nocardioides sp. Soil796]